jgi:anaerobic carbon-monoxide dehydrogenase catalytic subunit
MAEVTKVEKKAAATASKKVVDPMAASVDKATQQMIRRSQDLGIETCFDRALTLKACAIGNQGTCCKNCGMGPCRLPVAQGL